MLYLCTIASKIHRKVRRRIVFTNSKEVSPIAMKGLWSISWELRVIRTTSRDTTQWFDEARRWK
jgi:hypothetical protein